jgi:peroxiredoxin
MSASPEDLLGKQAPDFTLDALAGSEIHLHELIKGKVAVIAFCSGVAPHLTTLYDQFKDKGLVVVAVNCEDESKEELEKRLGDKRLTYPIGLMGWKVGTEKYTVASYPVTFLVDSQGTIVDYQLGSEPGDEKLLAPTIGRLLAQ